MAETIILTTICLVWDQKTERILMINRQKGGWTGYAPPGGHVEFPESLTECAIREVREETGLTVADLAFKGLAHFVNKETQERYMVFQYFTEKFSGELSPGTSEGRPEWVSLVDIGSIPLAPGIAERLELFFRDRPSEMHRVWDKDGSVQRIFCG